MAVQDSVRTTFAEASSVLGYDLWQLIASGPEEKLNATEFTQPAMLAAGIATWRLWRDRGGAAPSVVSGHSLGEFTALVCAESLDFAAAVGLVSHRGKLMQEAVPAGTGAMAAILGLEDAQVEQACREASGGGVVEAVNFNAPGQIVIAGDSAAVQRAIEAAKALGAKRASGLAGERSLAQQSHARCRSALSARSSPPWRYERRASHTSARSDAKPHSEPG